MSDQACSNCHQIAARLLGGACQACSGDNAGDDPILAALHAARQRLPMPEDERARMVALADDASEGRRTTAEVMATLEATRGCPACGGHPCELRPLPPGAPEAVAQLTGELRAEGVVEVGVLRQPEASPSLSDETMRRRQALIDAIRAELDATEQRAQRAESVALAAEGDLAAAEQRAPGWRIGPHHTHVDRRGAGARADAVAAGHSVVCAQYGTDPACPGPAPEPRSLPSWLTEPSSVGDAVMVVSLLALGDREKTTDHERQLIGDGLVAYLKRLASAEARLDAVHVEGMRAGVERLRAEAPVKRYRPKAGGELWRRVDEGSSPIELRRDVPEIHPEAYRWLWVSEDDLAQHWTEVPGDPRAPILDVDCVLEQRDAALREVDRLGVVIAQAIRERAHHAGLVTRYQRERNEAKTEALQLRAELTAERERYLRDRGELHRALARAETAERELVRAKADLQQWADWKEHHQ